MTIIEQLAVHVSGQGPAWVFLHGWGSHAGIWQRLQAQLESQVTLYCVDLPGHGANPAINSGLAWSEWVPAILAVVPKRAVWVGWSLGGLLALLAAAKYPQRVEQLFLLASTPKFTVDTSWKFGFASQALQQMQTELLQAPEAVLRRFISLISYGTKQSRQLGRELMALLTRPMPATPALLQGLACLQAVDARDLLRQLSCSIQFILAQQDALLPIYHANALATVNPTIRCHSMEAASHAFVWSEASILAQLLLQQESC